MIYGYGSCSRSISRGTRRLSSADWMVEFQIENHCWIPVIHVVVSFVLLMMPPSSYIQNQCDKTVNKADHDFPEIEFFCRLNSDGKIIDKTAVFSFLVWVFVFYNVMYQFMNLYLRFRPDHEEILNQRIKTFFRNIVLL